MATSARIEELKGKFDENPRRYFAPLANELRKQGDLSQAISICRAHLPNQPGHLSGHIVLAQALYEATDFEESRAEFQAALTIDPENLIALRFMGDLSNASGDIASARGWYQRVLDAEPRNYEIARIMRELNAPPNEDGLQSHESQPGHDTPVVSLAVTPRPDTASIAAPVSQQQAPALSHEVPADLPRDSAPGSEVPATQSPSHPDRGLRDTPLIIDIPDDAHPGPRSEATRPAAGSLDTHWDAEAVSASELSDLEAAPEDWFNDPVDPAEGLSEDYDDEEEYGGATTDVAHVDADHDIESLFATQGGQPPEMPARTELDTSTKSPASEAHSEIAAIDFDEVEEAFDAEPQAAPPTSSYDTDPGSADPATATEDPTTPAHELSSLENDGSTPEGDAAARASATPRDVEIVADHDDSSTSAAAPPKSYPDKPSSDDVGPATETQWWEPFVPRSLGEPERTEPAEEAFGQVPHSNKPNLIEPSIPEPETRIARTPEYVETVPESNAAPFVTETLAELYLQQGFREEALSIYRQLLQRNPSDDTLRNRVAAIEGGSDSYALDASAQTHGQPHHVSPTQSVRAFFGRLAKRPPRRRASVSGSGPLRRTGEFPAQSGPKDIESGGALHSAIPNASLEPQSPGGAASREGSSSLTRLFNEPALSREDQDAAAALATAFNSPAANVGRPSRVAEQELSLDHLFRDPAASDPAPVSLDDFYSAPRGATSNPNATESEPPDERAADIRQFTSWLEGLKKK